MTSSIRLRINEGESRQPFLLWDSIWQPSQGIADWALADPDEPDNQGGLRAKASLHTSVIICLMTDKRCPPDHPLSYLVEGDRRGWFGDGIDIDQTQGERDLGSLLWVFERAPLTEQIRKHIEAAALEALQTLIAQGAVIRIEAEAVAGFAIGQVNLGVVMYGRDGARVYDQKFQNLWAQTAHAPKPKPFPDFPPPYADPEVDPIPVSGSGLDFSDPANSQYLPLLM